MELDRRCRIARVRLSDGDVRVQEVPAEIVRRFLGGRGLGLWMMESCADDSVPLIFMTGPLTDSAVPSGGRYCAVTRSPVSGKPISPSSGSAWGVLLRQAGWDGIVLEGAAPDWCYLTIEGSSIQLHSAAELHGRLSGETAQMLKGKHGAAGSVLCIGPAGENGVALSAILCDGTRAFGRDGIGAVMGAKKVKALVICAESPNTPGNACTRCPIQCGHADQERGGSFGAMCNDYGLDAIGTERAIAAAQELVRRGLLSAPALTQSEWIAQISRRETELARLVGSGTEALCRKYGAAEPLRPAGKTARSGLRGHLSPELAAVIDSMGYCLFTAAGLQPRDYAKLLREATHRKYSEADILQLGSDICRLEQSLSCNPILLP